MFESAAAAYGTATAAYGTANLQRPGVQQLTAADSLAAGTKDPRVVAESSVVALCMSSYAAAYETAKLQSRFSARSCQLLARQQA